MYNNNDRILQYKNFKGNKDKDRDPSSSFLRKNHM